MVLMTKKFTLLELMIVVAIIGLLITILLPSLRSAKESAKTAICMSNLSSLGQVAAMHGSDNNQKFWIKDADLLPDDPARGYVSWTTHPKHISPYISQTVSPWSKIDLFYCPSDPYARNKDLKWRHSYGYNVSSLPGQFMMSVKNPSETIFLADSGHDEEDGYRSWIIRPNQVNKAIYNIRHVKGANVLWTDGSVSFKKTSYLSVINNSGDLWDLN